jgi:hypothetical protein
MAPHTIALEQCFDEVTDSAPLALERCLDHVVLALQQAEGNSPRSSERAELGEAWRELLEHKASWCQRYPDALRAAFRSAGRQKPASTGASLHSRADKVMALSLVDDADIVEAIETSRLVQHVMPLLERPVSELDALVSSAMGLETVQAELNPVRPEVFAQTLRGLIGRTQVKAATGSLWMKYMAEPLGAELEQLYGRLVVQLNDANVQAVGYGRTRASGNTTPSRSSLTDAFAETQAPAQDDEEQPSSAYGRLSSQQISHALLRDFLFRGGDAQASQAPSAAYYAGVERELAQLRGRTRRSRNSGPPAAMPTGYRELQPVDRPSLAVGVQSTLSSAVWGQYADSHERSLIRSRLRQDVTQMAQVLGMELVHEVVSQVARDPRLLTPLREAIVALEPSLLRLAMVDPRFFSDERHPGRLLMERVAQRSFRYNDEFTADFAGFFAEVSREFNALNQLKIANAQPFEAALIELVAGWGRQDSDEDSRRSQAVRAVRFAELRQAEADLIAWDLGTRPDLDTVPPVIQDFLFGPWALVLAHARLTDTTRQIDPNGYRAVISDLLWSVKRDVTLRQPAQLFERVPSLLAKLREGLASLGQDPAEHEGFFQALMKLHHPVLKLRRAKSRRDARESGMSPLAAVDAPAATQPLPAESPPVPGQPWMSPRELEAAGFKDTLPTDMGQLTADPGDSSASPLQAQAEAPSCGMASARADTEPPAAVDIATILAQLREGDWVDLYSKRSWHRAQLIWASSKGTLFMFVSHGGRPHSMTKRICERLIGERYLRPVRAHSVVAQALGALDQEAPSV